MVKVSPFTIIELKKSYTSKEHVEKQIPLKKIPLGTAEPLEKNVLEDKNYKQVLTSIGGPLKNREMLRDENL